MTVLPLTGDQCRIGRAAIGLGLDDLARAAAVAPADLVALERGDAIASETAGKIARALEAAGVTFFSDAEGRPRLRARTLDGIIEAPVSMSQRRDSRD